MTDLTNAENRVASALAAKSIPSKILVLDQLATTAQMAADALNVQVGQIVKSLCFQGKETQTPIMLLVSGDHRVHERRVSRIIGEKLVRADAKFVKLHTGFSIGGVSPFGHPQPLPVWMDEHLLDFEMVWAAAGNPRSVFEIAPRTLLTATNAQSICVI